jgi:hypothetical protein
MKQLLRIFALLSLTVVAGFDYILPQAAQAQINYQGRLTDSVGAPLTPGQYSIEFSLWDAATGGATPLWGPFITDADSGDGHGPLADIVTDGRFNVIINNLDTASRSLTTSLGASESIYLQIQLTGNDPITPRQVILPAPRALRADVIPNVTPSPSGVEITGNVGIDTAPGTAKVTTLSGDSTYGFEHSNGTVVAGTRIILDSALFGTSTNHPVGLAVNNGVPDLILWNNRNISISGLSEPTEKLVVRGNIKFGSNGQDFATGGEENLRIVRGTVKGTTASGLNFGTGWTVTTYGAVTTVNFSTSFSARPSITATAEEAPEAWHVDVQSVTTSSFNVVSRRKDGVAQGIQFNFIAIGPR